MNFRYPIYLDLTGKRCLVTGEGEEVAAKVAALVDASAEVIYVNREAVPEIRQFVDEAKVQWMQRDFEPGDLQGCFMVITCRPENAEIFQMAEERGMLCNAVDDPKNCRFSHGSIHRQGDLTIGISTNGTAPAIAVRIKEMLRREVGPEYQQLMELIKRIRPQINVRVTSAAKRKTLLYRIVDSEVLSLFRSGDSDAASTLVQTLIDEAASNT